MKAKKSLGLQNKYVFARAKKSLGQNFLKSEIALRKIIEAGEIKPSDIILEIGPGKGALTEKLLEKSNHVIAVEKDHELFEFLKEKFREHIKSGSLVLVHGDILNYGAPDRFSNGLAGRGTRRTEDLRKPIGSEVESEDILSGLNSYKIIANIPYNITGAILKRFLTAKHQPTSMVLMVQHEVAQRMLGNKPSSAKATAGKKESLLSISVKAYGEPKMIMKVDKRYFSPAPKVNSAIIAIKNISRKIFTSPRPSPYKGEGDERTVQDKTWNSRAFEEKFWEIVKAGFAHKRKKLSSNLKEICQRRSLTKDGSKASVFASVLVENLGNKRAEDLTLLDWIELTKALGKT